jgi:TolB-like protein/DNA-binding winged helix-turn-helix (wHTH) protein/Tfp pilus assembly protein PilF
VYEFGPFRLDAEERQLFRDDTLVPLTPKAFDLLLVLVESQGKLLTKQHLLQQVWPDSFVEEANLAQNVATLRKALGETVAERQFIETVSKQGYRFVGLVRTLGDWPGARMVAEGHTVDQPVTSDERLAPNPVATKRRRYVVGVVAASLLVAAGLLTLAYYLRRATAPNVRGQVTSLVVLPFVNMNANAEDQYFSDGLTEEVINAVAGIQGLRVVARTSAFQFRGKAQDIRGIAERLHVGAVLEGSVRREQNRLRVTAQLITAADGYHVWSRSWDRDLQDVFAVQQEIAEAIADTIGSSRAVSARGQRTSDLEAYNLYLQGQYHQSKRFGGSIEKAIGLFQQALAKDPNYAAGWAALADCYEDQGFTGQVPPKVAYPKAVTALRRALQLDDTLSNAHTVQAKVSLFFEWDWARAEREARRALALDSSDPRIHHWRSHYFVTLGRLQDSLAESNRALELDPLNAMILGHLAWHYFYAGDYEAAIAAGERTLEIDPNHIPTLMFLQWTYEQTGRFEKAMQVLERQHAAPELITSMREAFRATGPSGYWRVLIKDALERSRRQYVSGYRIARLQALSGAGDDAIRSLQRSAQERDSELVYLKVERTFDGIRSDPRFVALVNRVGIP